MELPITHRGVDCGPVKELLARIASKWSVMIVTRLSKGPMRFSDLKREIGDVSQKMLTTTLRSLEEDGFVRRVVTPTLPPRVDYELTELGLDLLEPLEALGAWAVRNRSRVEEARAAFRKTR
ncbi:helix-turn-helix domain-containing protein [Chelativorans sp.]|uniref:winged helix-turn-helix transcriptional regulator n=1 Tax=Chelativorans sp. TaxID=2203393 RepID=UPI0028128D60|nr:helix-turn-helix domain-containing protein [Chelativorans sp.]